MKDILKNKTTLLVVISFITILLFVLYHQGKLNTIIELKKENPEISIANIPNACEKKVDNYYTNTVPAKIENVGNTLNPLYLLTFTKCQDKTVSIYINEPNNLADYSGSYVDVKYKYVDVNVDVRCIKAPCNPVTEKRVDIISITKNK